MGHGRVGMRTPAAPGRRVIAHRGPERSYGRRMPLRELAGNGRSLRPGTLGVMRTTALQPLSASYSCLKT